MTDANAQTQAQEGQQQEVVSKAEYEKVVGRAQKMEALAKDWEKKLEAWKGFDPEQVRAVFEEKERLEKEAAKNSPDELEKHFQQKMIKREKELGSTIEDMKRQLDEWDKQIKTLTVTDKVMEKIAGKFNEDMLRFIKLEVEQSCDLVDGQIVIKDDQGNIRTSKKVYGEVMGPEEFGDFLVEKYPSAAKARGVSGGKEAGTKVNGRAPVTNVDSISQLNTLTNPKEALSKMSTDEVMKLARGIKFT